MVTLREAADQGFASASISCRSKGFAQRIALQVAPMLGILLACNSGAKDRTRLLSRYVGRSDTSAVLILDPGDCLACNNAIGDWIAWARDGRHRELYAILTRQPTRFETAVLRTVRLRIAEIASGKVASVRDPTIYLVGGGRIIDSASGQKGLLSLVTRHGGQ